MSLTVAFPDFSARREQRDGRTFVCTLRASEVGPAWVHVAGDLDRHSAGRLEQAFRHTDWPQRLVVLDLRGLSSLDSTGARVIVEASLRARRAQRRLIVVRGNSEVDRTLRLADAADAVEVVELHAADPPEPTCAPPPSPDDAA